MPDHQSEEDGNPPDRSEKNLFFAALEIEDPTERAAWLEEACGDDANLRARVLELLKVEEEDHAEFLEPDHDRLGEVVSAVRRELREDDAEADTMLSDVDAEPTPADEAGIQEQPGDTIDRYKLLQKLGEGGGGVVYLAKQTEPVKRKVALKVIKLGMDTRQVVARFEAERQALAMMDHPNIATCPSPPTYYQTGREEGAGQEGLSDGHSDSRKRGVCLQSLHQRTGRCGGHSSWGFSTGSQRSRPYSQIPSSQVRGGHHLPRRCGGGAATT